MGCTNDCGSDRSEFSKYICVRCGGRTRPHRSRLTPSGRYICVACLKRIEHDDRGHYDPKLSVPDGNCALDY